MEHIYNYALDSALAPAPNGGAALSLATSGGVDARREPATHPFFYAGTLREPNVTAACLSTLSNIVASHFVADVVERLAQKDPVVTSGDGTLRFEGFSGCCGLYARLDLSDDALNTIVVDHGTTNVDFNSQMLAMLSRVSATDDVSISVGQQEVAITRGDELVRERKVKLPDRWVRGFAEAAVFQSRMEPALRLPKAQALRLLSSLPRGRPHDHVAWVVPSARSGARFSQTRDPDGVQVRGIGRLAMLRALMRHVRQLTIFRDPLHEEVSAWQLDLAAQRMTVVLSPGVYRGFSGEGQVLFSLAASTDDGLLEAVDEQLCWQSALNAQNVATLLDVSTQTAESALVCLGAEGLMGYDFRDQGFFHRELPFDREKVELRNPRLVGARELLKRNSVSWLSEGQLAEVHSEDQIYRVELQPQPPHRCNCQWYAKYQGRRGTCKHILAVLLLLQGDGAK